MFFSRFERLVARRYLKAKRREGFISVITGFAFTGIALGVATLIIVMSVMNGFRHELLSRILGINGHIGIMAVAGIRSEAFSVVLTNAPVVPASAKAAATAPNEAPAVNGAAHTPTTVPKAKVTGYK